MGGKPSVPSIDNRPVSEASKYAADRALEASKLSIAEHRAAREDAKALIKPHSDVGVWALGNLAKMMDRGMLRDPGWWGYDRDKPVDYHADDRERPDGWAGFTIDDMVQDPGYQFRLGEGEKAIRRRSNVDGSEYSGATLKALQAHGQDLASQEFQAARGRSVEDHQLYKRDYESARANRLQDHAQRWDDFGKRRAAAVQDYQLQQNMNNNIFNRYASISGKGQVASTNLANIGMTSAQGVGQSSLQGAAMQGNAMMQGAQTMYGGQLQSQRLGLAADQMGFNNMMSIFGMGLGMFGG